MMRSSGRYNSRQKLRVTESFQVRMVGTVPSTMVSKRVESGENTDDASNKITSKQIKITRVNAIYRDVLERVSSL